MGNSPVLSISKNVQTYLSGAKKGSNRISQYGGVKTNKKGGSTGGQGSLPANFDQATTEVFRSKNVDVVSNFRWTLSELKDRDDIPYIKLVEHRNNESMLKRQALFYAKGSYEATGNALNTLTNKVIGSSRDAETKGILDVYDEIWPDNPTGWGYKFPYFSKSQYQLGTPEWQQVDGVGEAAEEISSSLAGVADSLRLPGLGKFISGAGKVASAVTAAAELGLKALYPVVGVVDRPRIFTGHNNRSLTIQFPLYNTVNSGDWAKNRDFYYIFASQNLFAKRDFITGLPPVFYRVYVPGQYFSFASCVTDFTVENLGNTRLLPYGQGKNLQEFIVPDAYQISITLTEMVMPSLNQFQSVVNGDAANKVNVLTP